MNIKQARPETALVTHELIKTCLSLQTKDMSRDTCSTTQLLKKRLVKVVQNTFSNKYSTGFM